MNIRLLIAILTCFAAQVMLGQSFVDESVNLDTTLLVPESTFGNGVTAFDFNQDGWDDITFCNYQSAPVFLLNQGDGTFQEIELPGAGSFPNDTKHMTWVDYENDGDLDLFFAPNEGSLKMLENQGDMTFVDITASAGFHQDILRHYGACWGDYDNDGFLDVYVCKYYNPDIFDGYHYTNHLYHNEGDGTFTEVSETAGVGDGIGASFQSVFVDYDRDGWLDIHVINDRFTKANTMFRNLGDGTFEDVSDETGLGVFIDAMSNSFGDFDNDQDLDCYISNTFVGNFFMVNEDGVYSDQAADYGVLVEEISWGATWLDSDNDMDEDLYVSTIGNVGSIIKQNYYYENINGLIFFEENESAGLIDDDNGTYSIARGDFNNDGFPDFVQANSAPSTCKLWMNTAESGNNWLKVQLTGTTSNTMGIGSWIEVYADGVVQTRVTYCGDQYISQNSPREMFGLGQLQMADSMLVHWPSGHVDSFYNIPVNQTLHVIEGSSFNAEITYEGSLQLCAPDTLWLHALPNQESYLWNTGDTTASIAVTQSGDYFVEVVSAGGFNGESDILTVEVAEALTFNSTIQDSPCYGESQGSIELELTSDNNVQALLWSNGDVGLITDSLAAGQHELTGLYDDFCSIEVTYEIEQGIQIIGEPAITSVSCYGEEDGSVTIDPTGGTPPIIVDYGDFDPDALAAGTYLAIATDSVGCQTEFEFDIPQPDDLQASVDETDISDTTEGSATVIVEGGTPPYSFNWSTGDTTSVVSPLPEGDFTVTVVDANDCSTNVSFTITDILDLATTTRSVYPNPFSDFTSLMGEFSESTQVQLFDYKGQLVLSFFANGRSSFELGKDLAPGCYILSVHSPNREPSSFRLLKTR